MEMMWIVACAIGFLYMLLAGIVALLNKATKGKVNEFLTNLFIDGNE